MMPDPVRATADDLLAHSAWMRRLALALLRDRDDADELVQETYARALRRPPERGTSLRPWLATVARNVAAKWRRSDAHRREREEGAARRESLPSSSEALERIESVRLLLDALERLDEPYRATLIARYLDELPAAEIARREGLPQGTVRWRAQRGLELLREELEQRSRREGRDARALLLVCAGRGQELTTTAAAAATLSGVLAMHGVLKLGAAATIAVVAGFSIYLWRSADSGSVHPARTSPSAQAAPELASPERDVDARDRADARVALDRPAPGAAERPETPLAAEAADARITARLLTTEARAIAGGELRVRRGDKTLRAVSGSDGRAELSVPPLRARHGDDEALGIVLEVTAAGRASRFMPLELESGHTSALGDVVLEAGCSVRGLVLGPDERPFAGAELSVSGPDAFGGMEMARRKGPNTWPGAPTGTSDAQGRFRIDGIPATTLAVWAGAPGMRWTRSEPIAFKLEEEKSDVVVRLDRLAASDHIAGIVLSPAREPVPFAAIEYAVRTKGYTNSGNFAADAQGRFDLRLTEVREHELLARDPQDRWAAVKALAIAPGKLDVELSFRESRFLELELVDARGRPVEEAELAAIGEQTDDVIESVAGNHHDGGRARVRVPSGSFRVRVIARGCDTLVTEALDPAALPAQMRLLLASVPGVSGRVVRDGAPVQGAKVQLFESAVGRGTVQADGFEARFLPDVRSTDTTDSDGRFLLTLREDGPFFVLAEVGGEPVAEAGPLELRKAVGMTELELELPRGGAIEGHVLVSRGVSPEGTIVAVNRGDLRPRSMRVGPDGAFRFDGLAPGAWQVLRSDVEVARRQRGWAVSMNARDAHFDTQCEVRAGAVTRYDIDLVEASPCKLTGRLLLNGEAAAGWTVTLWPDASAVSNAELPSTALDDDGRFALASPNLGWRRLHFQHDNLGEGRLYLVCRVELRPGEQPWELDLAMGRVVGTVAPALASSPMYASWSGESGASATLGFTMDATGRFELSEVPAGKLVFREQVTQQDGTKDWREITSVNVSKGATSSVALQ